METILVVAAEARELAGLAQQLSGRRKLALSLGFAEQGELGGRRWLLAANGPGPKLAAAAVKAFERPDRIVSTGYCGALDPALVPSDMVICNRVLDADTDRRFKTADEFGATCLSGDRVIQTAREKQLLRETTGASVCEMEAAGVAAEAEAMGVSFHCIRVVTDTSHEDLGVDFNACRDEDGRFQLGRIALSALRKPQHIRELLKLNERACAGTTKLGVYLAEWGSQSWLQPPYQAASDESGKL